jgi:hypothetical protein
MYTTTQLLYLLAALMGVDGHVSSIAQVRNEIAPTVTESVHAPVNGTSITAVDGKFAIEPYQSQMWRGSEEIIKQDRDNLDQGMQCDKHEDMAITYENTKPIIIGMMQNDRAWHLHGEVHDAYTRQVRSVDVISRLEE